MIFNLKEKGIARRAVMLLTLIASLTLTSTNLRANTGSCGGTIISVPFSDVQSSNIFFCAIAEAYFSGLTNGTTATTYSPGDNVTREQMAAFVSRTLDQSLARGSQRAALGQWWTQQFFSSSAETSVGGFPLSVKSDGEYLWVGGAGAVGRVRASDGKYIEFWTTGTDNAADLLIANGRIYALCGGSPAKLYAIDPEQPAGNAALLTTLPVGANGIAYDGEHILTANASSITNYHVPSGSQITYSSGFNQPAGIVYDGHTFWVTDSGDDKLKQVLVTGQISQVVDVGHFPGSPVFDGTNIWVPCGSNQVTVVRAATGQVIATLTDNGLGGSTAAAFDGERIMITNGTTDSVSLWRATDLKALGSFSTGAGTIPQGVCSDGINFWVVLRNSEKLARY